MFKFTVIFVCWFAFWAIPRYTQVLLLALYSKSFLQVLGGPLGVQGIEPKLAQCNASVLPIVLYFWSHKFTMKNTLLDLGALLGGAQGLLLTLYSGIISRGARETIWNTRYQIHIIQHASTLSAVLSL